MPCKLSFDDPNRESIIDSYLDAVADKGASREMKKCKSCKYYSPATLYSTIGYCRNESSVNFNSLGCEDHCCSHYALND